MKLEVDRCRIEMRIRAAASNDPPSCIYADNITALTGAAKATLPSVDTCKYFFKEICIYRIFIGFTKMPIYQNVCYQDFLLPKCLLPKCPITETSSYQNVLLPKCQLPKHPLPKCPLSKCHVLKIIVAPPGATCT